jgi:hypothetical protein
LSEQDIIIGTGPTGVLTTAIRVHDPVNPDHYKKGSMETIDQMLTLFGSAKVKAFCELNAFKYRMRAGHKSKNIEEDIKKAMWYEDKMRDVL